MNSYSLLLRGGLDYETATPEEIQKTMTKWKDWMDALTRDGKYTGGERLTSRGAVIQGDKKLVTDGPFTEGKEIIGGFISIKAPDLEDAIAIAKSCPIFGNGGFVEVREIAAM